MRTAQRCQLDLGSVCEKRNQGHITRIPGICKKRPLSVPAICLLRRGPSPRQMPAACHQCGICCIDFLLPPFDANEPILCELIPKRGLTPDQYEHLGRLFKQFCIEHRCPIADSRAVRDLPEPLVLRRVEEAEPRMQDDEDRWHFHQVLLHFMDDEAQSRSVFFSVRDSVFNREEFVHGLRYWIPAKLVEDVIVDGRSWDE